MTTLAAAAQTSSGLNLKGLVIVAIVFVLVYPLQKRLRQWVSKRRVERWHEEDEREGRQQDEPERPKQHDGPDDDRR